MTRSPARAKLEPSSSQARAKLEPSSSQVGTCQGPKMRAVTQPPMQAGRGDLLLNSRAASVESAALACQCGPRNRTGTILASSCLRATPLTSSERGR